jgi:hypothetical protein
LVILDRVPSGVVRRLLGGVGLAVSCLGRLRSLDKSPRLLGDKIYCIQLDNHLYKGFSKLGIALKENARIISKLAKYCKQIFKVLLSKIRAADRKRGDLR